MNIQKISMTELSHYALIRVSGIAAAAFLEGQLTCRVNQLKDKSSLAAHCNTKGRVRALYRIFRQGTDFYLRCPKSLLDKALAFLQFYARFSKVSLTPIKNIVGFGIIVPKENTVTLPFPLLEINAVTRLDEYTILRVPGNADWDRYEIYAVDQEPNRQLHTVQSPNTIKSWLSTLTCLETNQWCLTDILAGIPDVFPETTEQFLPHDIGLPQLGAVSFSKGCYLGQEIIARMEYRSKQRKYHLVLTQFPINTSDDIPKPGDMLSDKRSLIVSISAIYPEKYAYALIQTPTQKNDKPSITS